MISVRPPRRSASDPEAGFTLVEVIVAIMLIGASLMTLVGLSTAGLKAQEAARRQQVANGIASEVMERLRGLSFSELTDGAYRGDLAGDPNVVGGCLRQCTVIDGIGGRVLAVDTAYGTTLEAPDGACVVFTSTADLFAAGNGRLPLNPYHCTQYTLNGVTYRARAYVTETDATGGVLSDSPYRLTVMVEWGDGGDGETTLLQSMVYAGRGCSGAQLEDFASGPCGRVRDSVYRLTNSLPSLRVQFCKLAYPSNNNPVTGTISVSNCSPGNPSVEIQFASMDLRYHDQSGEIVASAGVGLAQLSVDGSIRSTQSLATAPSLSADNLDSTPTVANPPSVEWSAGSALSFASAEVQPTRFDVQTGLSEYKHWWSFLGTWRLEVTIERPSDCGGLACGSLAGRVDKKPAITAASSFSRIRVDACKVGSVSQLPSSLRGGYTIEQYEEPPNGCYTVAAIDGGNAAGLMDASSSALSTSGYRVDVGGVLGSSGAYLVSADAIPACGSSDPYASSSCTEDVTRSLYWWALDLNYGTNQCTASGSSGYVQSVDAPTKACLYYGPSGAIGTQVWQLQGLGQSGAKWIWAHQNGPTYCQIPGGNLLGVASQGGGTYYARCQQIAPVLSITWGFPEVRGTETPLPAVP